MTEQPNPEDTLLSAFSLTDMLLRNRVVMAAMTRGRATNTGLVPTDLHVEYYRQRASAGLIVTEATWISQDAIGVTNVPGMFTEEQTKAWRLVTEAVHGAGGRIFAQIAHSGAVSHPDFFSGRLPSAPSAVNPGQQSFTPTGFKETVTPRAMTVDEIKQTIGDYASAARNARIAGFDGVELHAGGPYLMPEFLNSNLNRREDQYGGWVGNRVRIVLETLDAMVAEWGAGKVGIKISPALSMGGFTPTLETIPTYDYLVERLNDRPLSHLQIVRAPQVDLSGSPVAAIADTIGYYRDRYRGTLIANGGFDAASARDEIAQQRADLISFGGPFISNPDLVRRFAENLPLSPSDRATYYQGSQGGYVDYPSFTPEVAVSA